MREGRRACERAKTLLVFYVITCRVKRRCVRILALGARGGVLWQIRLQGNRFEIHSCEAKPRLGMLLHDLSLVQPSAQPTKRPQGMLMEPSWVRYKKPIAP
jgi:hypothetical protein